MQIILPSPEHARHIGKRLAKELHLSLTQGYAIAAQLLGYRTWDELVRVCNWPANYFDTRAAWPDGQCMAAAIHARRTYQVRALMTAADLAQDRAQAMVDKIKPTAGFTRPALPDEIDPAPRTSNPRLSHQDHAWMSTQLHVVWQSAGRHPQAAPQLRRAAATLECLQLAEWPSNQFGTSLRDTCYVGTSPTYLARLHRAPRWISQQAFDCCDAALAGVEARIVDAGVEDLPELVRTTCDAVRQARTSLSAWRNASAPHDGQPVAWTGVMPIEDEALAALEGSCGLSDGERFAIRHPVYDEECTRAVLAKIGGLPVDQRRSPAIKFASRKLRGGILALHNASLLRQAQPEAT
ncbi:hypothetical protein AACH06_25455 [Ideonella sp. DXS29W]|uniref:Uncharacterized protein n=1 Tax=Ideonella lacteola TaxID=2984193 RepID=A0ABU9BZD1_9BURK